MKFQAFWFINPYASVHKNRAFIAVHSSWATLQKEEASFSETSDTV
jgi:hypothetical protein